MGVVSALGASPESLMLSRGTENRHSELAPSALTSTVSQKRGGVVRSGDSQLGGRVRRFSVLRDSMRSARPPSCESGAKQATNANSPKIPAMDIPQAIEERLVNLEVKAAYADDLLDQLSDQIYRQQQQIDLLLHELRLMRERLPEAGTAAPRSLRDEIPPHY